MQTTISYAVLCAREKSAGEHSEGTLEKVTAGGNNPYLLKWMSERGRLDVDAPMCYVFLSLGRKKEFFLSFFLSLSFSLSLER